MLVSGEFTSDEFSDLGKLLETLRGEEMEVQREGGEEHWKKLLSMCNL